MTTLARPWKRMAGSLLFAVAASGAVLAQDVPALPELTPLPSAAPAAGPVAGEIRLEPSPGGVALPPSPPCVSPQPVHVSRDAERQTRRLRRRFHWQEHFLGYPEEFVAPPLGASVYANNRTQVANGEAARMVLYDYDFVEGTNQLNLRGQDQLNKILSRLPLNFFPVVIERTPRTPGLDETRRLAILSQIARSPFPVPAERVVVGPPIAAGLRGQEAQVTHNLLLNRTAQAGPPVSSGGGFSSTGTSGAAAQTGTASGAR
jgi:hypothetical protein